MNYERIVWVDVDIIINNLYAYDICNNVPIEKVGAVESYSIPNREIHYISLKRLYTKWQEKNIPFLDNLYPEDYYLNRGLPGKNLSDVVQTGVLVCSPAIHKDIFEYVYYKYEDKYGAEYNYEMPALSFELLQADLVYWISPRFNFCVAIMEAAFYPNSIYFQNKILNKILLKKQKISQLKNIYDFSIFMHFAGCSNKMFYLEKII